MSKEHLMIDLETMGTDPSAPIISIGAVFFDKTGFGEKFYKNLSVEDQIEKGRFPDGPTIKWWMSQSDAAKKVFKEDAVATRQGLYEFVNFITANCHKTKVKPWGNGSNFDITMLEDIFKQYKIEIPWIYRNIRDLRTFREFVYDGKDLKMPGTAHNALDDAVFQACIVIKGMKR